LSDPGGRFGGESGSETLPNVYANPNGAGNPNASTAIFYDAPGLFTENGSGTILGAVWVFNFVLQPTVSSGSQTVTCPSVDWQAIEIWQNGAPVYVSGSYVVNW
jgi:hypothetical protein